MKKLIVSSLGLALAFVASAVQVNSLPCVAFSTKGPDLYADGTPVMDGECYVLVYSEDGVFEGFNSDGTAIDANDTVVMAVPVAKGGRCPGVLLAIDAGYYAEHFKSTGTFAVYLADTRKFDAQGVATVTGVNGAGELTFVASSQKLDAAVTIQDSQAPNPSVDGAAVDGSGAVLSQLAGEDNAKIADIDVQSDKVVLTVVNTRSDANYGVVGGEVPGAKATLGRPQTGNGTIWMIVPKTNANRGFFRIIRK